MVFRTASLPRINNYLVILIIAVNLFIIVTPFVPQLLFHVQNHPNQIARLERQVVAPPAAASQPNGVIIPRMLLDQPILEGRDTYAILNKGIWRWPASSTPDKAGNTVLIGHRFMYTTPRGVFYFLDKLHPGDHIGVVWNNKTYSYAVTDTKTVPPSQTSILDQTATPTLTLYTCTPLWLPKDRLVVTAHLEGTYD